MVIVEMGSSSGAGAAEPYLTNGAGSTLTANVNVAALAANLSIKGNAAASRTITLGQQAANADIVNIDTINANARVNGSEILTVGSTATITGAKTFNDQTIKLRNPGNTFSYTVVHSAITAARSLTVPLLTGDDTLAVLAEAQTLTNKTLGTGTVFSVIPTINDGITFTFNPSATVSGLNVGAHSSDPSTQVNGNIWYNSTDERMRYRQGGVTFDFGSGSGGAPVDATYLVTSSNGTLTAEVVVGSLTGSLTIAGNDAAGRTITFGQQVTNADTVNVDVPVGNFNLNGVPVLNTTGTATITNKTISTGTTVSAAISWASGVKQTFTPNATTAGFNVGSLAGNPSGPANGDAVYNTSLGKWQFREAGAWVGINAAGTTGTWDQVYDSGGSGSGKAATVDSGAFIATTPDTSNNRVMDLVQNDVTNNPATLGLANAGSGSHLTVTTSNQDLRLSANGTGLISLDSSVKLTNQGVLRFMEATGGGTNYVAFQAASALSGNTTWILPSADGTANQVLVTNGSGVLSWASIAASWVNDTFTGDSSTTVFTLSATPSDNDGVIVSEDSGIQIQGGGNSYTVSGTSLTFVTAPATGVIIQAKYMTGGITGVSHALLSSVHSDVVAASVVRGDIVVGNSTPNWNRLALGAVDTALVSNGTDLVYRKMVGDFTIYPCQAGGVWTDNADANPTALATGTIKEDRDTSARRNYLHMEDSSGTLKTFTHVIEMMIPWGFRGYATSNCIVVNFRTESTSAANNKLDVTIRKTGGTLVAQKTAQVSGSANTWTTCSFDFADLTSPPAAGALIVIELLCYSKSGNHVEFGEITFAIGAN